MPLSPREGACLPTMGNTPPAGRGWGAWLPAGLLLVAGLIALLIASILDGRPDGAYLVIAPSGATLAETINLVRAADGRLVQAGRFPNMVVAGSDRPDFAAAARRAGAWLAIAAPYDSGCVTPSSQEKSS